MNAKVDKPDTEEPATELGGEITARLEVLSMQEEISGMVKTLGTRHERLSKAVQVANEIRRELEAENARLKQEVAELRSGKAFLGEKIKPGEPVEERFFWNYGGRLDLLLHSKVMGNGAGSCYRYTGPTTAPLPDELSAEKSNPAEQSAETGTELQSESEDATPLPEWLAKGVRVRLRWSEGWAIGLTEPVASENPQDDWPTEVAVVFDDLSSMNDSIEALEVISNPKNDPELAARIAGGES